MLLSLAYANRNYRAAAGRQDKFVPDSHACEGGRAKRAEPGARGDRASTGCARSESGGGVQTEKNHLRDDRVRRYRRIAEGPRKNFGVSGAAARGGRPDRKSTR